MSLTTRRRAIYTGLAGHFGEDEILPLLSLWEAKYADKPPFALNEFLGEVAHGGKDEHQLLLVVLHVGGFFRHLHHQHRVAQGAQGIVLGGGRAARLGE